MAGDWIPMRTDLWECPQVVRIVSALCPQDVRTAAHRCQVIGALWRTWSLIDQYCDDGTLHGYTAEMLDEAVGINGWSHLLEGVGWLAIEAQGLVVPSFESWFGSSARRRIKEAQRKRKSRANTAQSVRIDADKSVTRGEKRREEESTGKEVPNGTSPPKQVWGGDTWPLASGKVYQLPVDVYQRYRATYAWDIDPELRKCAQWCRENKSKRSKSAKGMQSRITSWLNRADEKHGRDGRGRTSPMPLSAEELKKWTPY